MKVLALVQAAYDVAPGQRYRIEQWDPLLRKYGIEIHYEPFQSVAFSAVIYKQGQYLKKTELAIQSFLKRLRIVNGASEYDLIYVLREASVLGPPLIERKLKNCGIPVIYDFDDAVWLRYISPTNGYASLLKGTPGKTRALCRLAAHVMAGNNYLADFTRQFNKNVTVVPTTIDIEKYKITPRPKNEVPVIGWTGSHSTLRHLDTLRGALLRLAKSERFRLRVIGATPYELPGVDVENIKWRSASEVEDLRPIDIGIMPLPDDPWARGKCALKALQYMALGIPTALSPVGVNAEIVQDGRNGYLASTEDQWVEKLTRLLHNSELRQQLGAAGRQTLENNYSAQVQVPRIARIFTSVATPKS
jgi:glycosyltransferase involved in cell wall biosynthesis